jgi:adenosylcobinamide-phosphate synthase
MIVGRDTDALDEAGIVRATVETVAENTSDGVIAPLLYTFFGTPVLGMCYKAVNTMDSMLGYHNDEYENFGKFAARADDVANFIPSRLSAIFMSLAAGTVGCSMREAFRIWIRDRYKHKSPNSAQTESACAGALGVRLGGSSRYKGVLVEKPYIGDDTRPIVADDIRRAVRLMFETEIVCTAVIFIITGLILIFRLI